MRKNSKKNTRINSEVQREVSQIIREEIKDPRIHSMASVTEVIVAPDLKTCRIYISVLGDKKAKEDTINGLVSARGFVRSQLARRLNLRNTPEINFILDETIEYAIDMSSKIDQIKQQDDRNAAKEM
ncbi:MAG: 30S ribosome-binding factor RbfA [Lachnospiraceae bacterium]